MNDDITGRKQTQNQWSQKEILGHLIDSTSNNQRIIRALYNVGDKFPIYDQNEWVRVQNYNEMQWNNLVGFWAVYNNHLSVIIEQIPESARSASCKFQRKDGQIILDQIRTVDKSRLVKKLGRTDKNTASKVLSILQEIFHP